MNKESKQSVPFKKDAKMARKFEKMERKFQGNSLSGKPVYTVSLPGFKLCVFQSLFLGEGVGFLFKKDFGPIRFADEVVTFDFFLFVINIFSCFMMAPLHLCTYFLRKHLELQHQTLCVASV
jgi:hypothetical protein